MRKPLMFVLGLPVLGLATLAIAGVLLLHFDRLCGEETVVEKKSPDGRFVAALMSRNCGATTGCVQHINLRLASSRFRSDFLGGTITEGEIWGSSKYSGERFCWSGPTRLELGYPTDGTWSVARWRDVTIGDDYQNPLCQ